MICPPIYRLQAGAVRLSIAAMDKLGFFASDANPQDEVGTSENLPIVKMAAANFIVLVHCNDFGPRAASATRIVDY